MTSRRSTAVVLGVLLGATVLLGIGRVRAPVGSDGQRVARAVVSELVAPPVAHVVSATRRLAPDPRLPHGLLAPLVVLLAVASTARRIEQLPGRSRALLRWHGTTVRGPPVLR